MDKKVPRSDVVIILIIIVGHSTANCLGCKCAGPLDDHLLMFHQIKYIMLGCDVDF
jgi:hypothetical protein